MKSSITPLFTPLVTVLCLKTQWKHIECHMKFEEMTFSNAVVYFVCVDALHPSKQLFSHVETFSCLPGLNHTEQIGLFGLILYIPVNYFYWVVPVLRSR